MDPWSMYHWKCGACPFAAWRGKDAGGPATRLGNTIRRGVCVKNAVAFSTMEEQQALCPRYHGDGFVFVPERIGRAPRAPEAMRFAVRVSVVRLSPQSVLVDVEGCGEGPTLEDAASWAFARAFESFARWERKRQAVLTVEARRDVP